MITGAIAVVLLIAVIIPAAANGNWGVVATFVVIGILVLWFGAASREQDRAYNNFVHFWATGEGPRGKRKAPQKSSGVLTREELDAYMKRAEVQEHARQAGGSQRISRADLKRMRQQGPDVCPKCGKQVYVNWRDVYVGGKAIRTGTCPRCEEQITKEA